MLCMKNILILIVTYQQFLAPSGAQEMLMFVRLVQVCLELSIFIILSQVSLRSLSGLFQVPLSFQTLLNRTDGA